MGDRPPVVLRMTGRRAPTPGGVMQVSVKVASGSEGGFPLSGKGAVKEKG